MVNRNDASIFRPEADHQRRGHAAIGVARQHLGLGDGAQHRFVPCRHTAGARQFACQNLAVGRGVHLHFGGRVAADGVGEHDVGLDAGHDAPGVAGRRAGRFERRSGGTRCTAGVGQARDALQILLPLGFELFN